MSSFVLPEMVRSHEFPTALVALVWSVSGIDPFVSSKLIRAEELPCTAIPVTCVGLLTCVFALVTHKVRALGISFSTAVICADVRP